PAGGVGVARRDLADLRRAEAARDTALQGQLAGDVPHAVQPRTEVVAVDLVAIQTYPAGQGEALAQAPLVLGEHGLLLNAEAGVLAVAAAGVLVDQATVTPLPADHQIVCSQRHRQLGVQGTVADVGRAVAAPERAVG